jgi:hypothetical protein
MHTAAPPFLYLRPIVKRSLATIRQYLSEGQVAFFLGSGVDIQLAYDGVGRGAPSWQQLISSLWAGVNDAGALAAAPAIAGCPMERSIACCQDTYFNYANQWPTEMASLIRWWLGDQKFSTEIDSKIRMADYTPNLSKPFTDNLCNLLMKTNLVVTPNYSDLIYLTLDNYLTTNRINKKIVVFNREDLGAFQFPAPKRADDEQIFLIHIHGRCSSQSFPILDAWGYNLLGNDDTHYQRFLETLFTERHVITLGNSWTDIPQRNAAAYAQRTKHYLSKTHLACMVFDPAKEPFLAPIASTSVDRKWANTMKAAYGANVARVEIADQANLLAAIGHPLAPPPDKTDLGQVADYFDDAGDYESPLQHQLLASYGDHDPNPRKVIASGVVELCNLVRSDLVDGDTTAWQVAARLERHLRHHIWVYVTGDTRDECRTGLWQDLATNVPAIDVFKRLPEWLRFDFLVGRFEILNTSGFAALNDYDLTITDPIMQRRLSMAKNKAIWKKVTDLLTERGRSQKAKLNTLNQNAEELLKMGWESLAAKVLVDGAELLARMAKDAKGEWKDVMEQALRAEAVARTAGCFRRRIKADIIGAIWNQDPQYGRTRLLGRLRASEAEHGVEPGLKHAIGAGLLACLLRSLGKGHATSQLAQEAKRLFRESGIDENLLEEALEDYWLDLMPKKLARCLKDLREHLSSVGGRP